MASEYAELLERIDAFERKTAKALAEIHLLVNSRMSSQLDTMRQLAEAQEQIASMIAEKRGIAIGLEQAKEEAKEIGPHGTGDG